MPRDPRRPTVVELFAGVGGFRIGLERCGWEVIWANQWEPSTSVQHAFDCYVSHFQTGEHVSEDIHKVMDEVESGQREIPDHELLVGGFPCFSAGTMVLTKSGHKPIEQVAVGELVLTHRGRWRPVTKVMSRLAGSTISIRGHGFPGITTTPEHPFWARRRSHAWSSEQRRAARVFDEPSWVAASSVANGTFVSQVYPVEHPSPPVEIDQSNDFFWLVGRYLADGWLASQNGKGRVVICASKDEAARVERQIRRVFPCTPSVERTVVKFHISRTEFHRWLADFGKGAGGKRIPGWLLQIAPRQARALLAGYATGDGSPWQRGWKATTVSRALALGIALLAQKAYGVVASVHEAEMPAKTVIEGRTVNQRRQYQVVIPPRNRSAFIEGEFGWKLVRSAHESGAKQVYNLAVEDDESYTADGCVVHNCQDYSVARPLNQAAGISGKKGVLWWEIHRLLTMKRPRYLFLENVDRLLKSPAKQRGRDFGVMLATLDDLGYEVEWRVVNAADYGFPQKRRRVLLIGRLAGPAPRDPNDVLYSGPLARALPLAGGQMMSSSETFSVEGSPADVSESFGATVGVSPFRNAGYMSHRRVWTLDLEPRWDGPMQTLADVLEPATDVPEQYFIAEDQLPRWRYLKGAKREQRYHKGSDTPYFYVEGPIPYPDRTDWPARTILTGEGGRTPSRFKHLVQVEEGRLRRLTPRELERLNGFPDDWTNTGMSDGRRAFMMGNALVVGLVERVGRELMVELREQHEPVQPGSS
ncbi:MAG: DNA (cytosine-5-)-methyltransferase [Chloroflexota bacterium]